MIWFRIDNRLIHGQIIEAWLPYLAASRLVVVNDLLAHDCVQQTVMQLAVPSRIAVSFAGINAAKAIYDACIRNAQSALFLLANCNDARRLTEGGVPVGALNIGNMHYSHGKKYLCPHVAASEDDILCLQFLQGQGVTLDFRCVPGDTSICKDLW